MILLPLIGSANWPAARKKDKKKPKTLQSWAKSTKGGGWRRQLGQAQEILNHDLSLFIKEHFCYYHSCDHAYLKLVVTTNVLIHNTAD